MPHLVGYRLLQVGHWGFASRHIEEGQMLCRWTASRPSEPDGDFQFDGQRLPVASRSLDAVILPHALELCPSPHRLLREVDRVLRDRGRVIVFGFSPVAPWSLGQRLRPQGYPATASLYRLGRVCDWLDLLDFEVVRVIRYGVGFPYLPPDGVELDRPGWWRLPALLAQAYVVMAHKRVVPVTPLRLPRRRRVSVLPAGMPEPTSRLSQSNLRESA